MFTVNELAIIENAASIIESKAKKTDSISNPVLAEKLCITKLAPLEHEVFAALMLDSQHRLIEFKHLFIGTIDSASVYPREVVKAVLAVNAAAVILTHNHPSGVVEPSMADKNITTRLVNALQLIDVKVLDHIVVGVEGCTSFAQRGLL
jgi:DNA repair protein RadC